MYKRQIQPVLPSFENTPPPRDSSLTFMRIVKRLLAGDLGFTEVYTYSFHDDNVLNLFYSQDVRFVTIKNPISASMSRLRRSLIPGLFGIIEKNISAFDEFSVFEVGSVYNPIPSGEKEKQGEKQGLPEERLRACALILKKVGQRPVFFDMKGRIDALIHKLSIQDVEYVGFERVYDYPLRINLEDFGIDINYHPGRRALLCKGKTCFGIISELNPGLLKSIGVDFHTSRVAVCELDLLLLESVSSGERLKVKYCLLYTSDAADE